MPPISPDTVRAVTGAAFSILNEAQDLTSGRDPNYIRDAEPENVIDAIALEGARQGCRRYAENPGNKTARAKARIERACRPYLDDIGKPPGPTIKIPFRGGQCQATYFVNLDIINYKTDGTVDISGPSQVSVLGPVGGLTFASSGCGTVIGPLAPAAQGFCAFLSGGNGIQLVAGNGNGGISGTITSVQRIDSLPDECGDPPPEYTDPAPDPNPDPPGPQPFNPTPDIDIEIDVEIGPDGDIIIDIGTGPITIDPFGGDDNPDGGGGGGDNPPPGDIGSPAAPQPQDEEGEASGCAPAGSVLVGLKINIDEIPLGAREYFDGVYRGVCYVYMGTEGNLDHDPAGAMMSDGQFVFAEKENLTCWRTRANNDYVITTTPYYREIEE
jgi:hypothetical protein